MQIQYTEQYKVQRDVPPAVPAVVVYKHALMSEKELNDCIESGPYQNIDDLSASFHRESLKINDQSNRTDKKSERKIDDCVIQPFGRHAPESPEGMIEIKIVIKKVDQHEKQQRRILFPPL